MTRGEAKAEARRRWGPRAYAESYHTKNHPPHVAVGVTGEVPPRGSGSTWVEAFADADARAGDRVDNPADLRRLLGARAWKILERSFNGSVTEAMAWHADALRGRGFTEKDIEKIRDLASLVAESATAAPVATPRPASIRMPHDIAAYFAERLAFLEQEECWVVLVDTKHRPTKDVFVSKGSLAMSIVHPRDVFREAIRSNASAFALAHNHPSGDPGPSVEDIQLTKRIMEVATVVGIRFLDHVVVGAGSRMDRSEGGVLVECRWSSVPKDGGYTDSGTVRFVQKESL